MSIAFLALLTGFGLGSGITAFVSRQLGPAPPVAVGLFFLSALPPGLIATLLWFTGNA